MRAVLLGLHLQIFITGPVRALFAPATLETAMSSTVPADIARKLERRWSARARQAESFPARTERLKQNNATLVEGVEPPADMPRRPNEADHVPMPGTVASDD